MSFQDKDSDLPVCSPFSVCGKVDTYDTYGSPWMEKQCRCPGETTCSTSTHIHDGHTVHDRTKQYKVSSTSPPVLNGVYIIVCCIYGSLPKIIFLLIFLIARDRTGHIYMWITQLILTDKRATDICQFSQWNFKISVSAKM